MSHAAASSGGSSGAAGSPASDGGAGGAFSRGGSGGATAGRGGARANGGSGGARANAGAGAGGAPAQLDSTSDLDCDKAFIEAGKCNPQIQFANDAADGAGAMFDKVIPDPIAAMKAITCQVCTILYRDPSEVTRQPSAIRLHIYDFDGVANAGGGNINFSSRHIANYKEPKDALFEFVGVLIHETTHLYQFDAGGGGLVEGMADFVRIRAGHHRMNRRVKGGAWTDPYTTSGFFFSWLAGPGGLQADGRAKADPDIGWAINQAMRGSSFDMQVFMKRLDKDVDTLWQEYQDAL